MDTLKKWLPTGLLALGGLLGLILGFVAAFSDGMEDAYKIYTADSVMGIKIKMPTSISTHAYIAYIGGIVAGVLGLLSLAASAFVGYKVNNGELEGNIAILVISIITFVVVLAIAIAATVCHSDLKGGVWVMEQLTKEGIKIPTTI